ncbi:MAG TPA: hypothetical protein VMH85_00195 [Terriglobales bacterium]|nr:hypothetical protein [Terriglobales bacterium]
MRLGWFVPAIAALSIASIAAPAVDQPPAPGVAVLPCSQAGGSSDCTPSPKDLKKAREAFSKGVKLEREKHPEEALEEFESAARLAPRDMDYLTAREAIRQQLVFDHIQRGNEDLLQRHSVEALGEFRHALFLDPANQFAQQRLQEAMAEWAPAPAPQARVLESGGEVRARPDRVPAEFHYRGDSRSLLPLVAQTYGLKATLDDSVTSKPVKFEVGDANFYQAMEAACALSKTFWIPLGPKQILIAADTAENHRNFDQMSMRTFYVPDATTAQQVTEITNLLRTVFEIRFINAQPEKHTIVVRAPQRVLDAATRLMEGLDSSRPQVMLDIRVYEISSTVTRNMGLQIPNQFKLFNIPITALAALGGESIQDLVNQLVSSGGINQASNSAVSALLAQLQGQQNSIFSQPVATFGGGLTFMGLSLGTGTAQLQLNQSTVRNLEHAIMRAGAGSDTSFRLGTRYPVLNATFAPAFNSSAISQVLQNQSFTAPFPSFNYEDLGLSLKAKTLISGSSDVTLQLEMQLRTLQGQSINGVPIISNREYKGGITLKDGEPAVVASSVSRNEQRSMSGLPGFGYVPGLNQIMTGNSKEVDDDELLVVITPHVISQPDHDRAAEIWMSK